jgi:hypothetical protein
MSDPSSATERQPSRAVLASTNATGSGNRLPLRQPGPDLVVAIAGGGSDLMVATNTGGGAGGPVGLGSGVADRGATGTDVGSTGTVQQVPPA